MYKKGGDHLNKNSSALIIGLAIIISFTILGFFISSAIKEQTTKASSESENTYELINVSENNMIIFDKSTGKYWRKYIESNEGPTEWEEEVSPVSK